MKTDRIKSSSFLATAWLATILAALVLSAGAASADPRPPYWGNNPPPAQPSTRELAVNNLGNAMKVGTRTAHPTPLKDAAVTKVPCAACSYRPPMLVRTRK